MDFSLTSEQNLLSGSLADWLATHYDPADSRAAASATGWQPAVWQAFADDLGILGAALPEALGGSDGGPVDTMIIAERLGYALVVEPFVDTVVLGGGVLRRTTGSAAVVRGIVAGSVRIAPALLEPTSGYTAHDVSTTARHDGTGWVLTGVKTVVSGLPQATHLLVSARTAGERRDLAGISLFLVPREALGAGSEVHEFRTIDDRHAADVTFDDVQIPADALLGVDGEGWWTLSPALDEATAAAAEAVGCMRKVLGDTVEFAKQRRQFGQPIGSFQVLQHRMVDMHLEVEQAVSAVHLATLKLGAGDAERARAVSAAKVTIGRAARFVGQNAVQLHGGMGMTQEFAIGHYFKRLTAIEYEFGPADIHRARYAALTAEAPTT